jgi:hypothetical protein
MRPPQKLMQQFLTDLAHSAAISWLKRSPNKRFLRASVLACPSAN